MAKLKEDCLEQSVVFDDVGVPSPSAKSRESVVCRRTCTMFSWGDTCMAVDDSVRREHDTASFFCSICNEKILGVICTDAYACAYHFGCAVFREAWTEAEARRREDRWRARHARILPRRAHQAAHVARMRCAKGTVPITTLALPASVIGKPGFCGSTEARASANVWCFLCLLWWGLGVWCCSLSGAP